MELEGLEPTRLSLHDLQSCAKPIRLQFLSGIFI